MKVLKDAIDRAEMISHTEEQVRKNEEYEIYVEKKK